MGGVGGRGTGTEEVRIEAVLLHFVHSCAEKLQSDEQFSKNLFGPPLESAFDHEDFTGDGGRDFGGQPWLAKGLGPLQGQVWGAGGLAGGSIWG